MQTYSVGPNTKMIEGDVVSPSGAVVPLSATDLLVRSFTVTPLPSNTGAVRVGPSVTPRTFANINFPATGGRLYNLAKIYIKPDVAGEGVSLLALV
jgi:hypothetical protein